MKKFSILMLTALMAVCTFTACSDDDDLKVTIPEYISTTYVGYADVSFSYTSHVMPYLDQTVTIAPNTNGTVDMIYVNDTWGTFNPTNCTISQSGSVYTISGSGTVSVSSPSGSSKSYEYTTVATVSDDADFAMTISIPSLMSGGTTINFHSGDAPAAYKIAGTYTGNTVAAFAYAKLNYTGDTLTITANSDGTANVSYTNDGEHLEGSSAVALGFGTYADSCMTVVENSDSTYTMAGSGTISLSMSAGTTGNSYKYVSAYTINGSDVTAVYTLPIMGTTTVTFTSTSKK